MMDRKRLLLRKVYELFVRQSESHYVINILEETTFYDGATCDGYCLAEDIANELDTE